MDTPIVSLKSLNTQYQLNDNLTATAGRIFITGTQALVRLLLTQQRLDKLRGLNTAGFVTGYRGSPLGGVDMAMWRAKDMLDLKNISFIPAINEDLAATMLMGTQQAGVRDDRIVDGVFGLWYGKGPGVDRAGDALHHGNAAGASRHGGVLLIVGDDHGAASSSIPHASENTLAALGIPVIHPSSVEEYEYFGLWGWALSRSSGAWVAFKAETETVESGRTFDVTDPPEFETNAAPPADAQNAGLSGTDALEYSARDFLTPAIELRMAGRLQAVRAFAQRYPLDHLLDDAPSARLGIVTIGKATLDTADALLQLQETLLSGQALPPIRHYKIGLAWPLETQGFNVFAAGLDHILVIEEKSPLLEGQIRQYFYNHAKRPSVSGKQDLDDQALIPSAGLLRPSILAPLLGRWLERTAGLMLAGQSEAPHTPLPAPSGMPARRPYFCSGCPHSSSTKVPEGSQALAGVGCHFMATWMDRQTSGLTQMGGEGVDWIGLSRYTRMPHVFQNMGEGTYFHSGYLAIRQAIASEANITYKILFNDAVAMTGGQPVDGPISVPQICRQLVDEGAQRVVITTDEPDKYETVALPAGVAVHHRRELDAVQRELRTIKGVSVLIHDQTCAAEKRRRRKKGAYPDPDRRLFINKAVCEGCGDCGTQSNCLSLVPVETPFGRKRAIDQSSCNKDYSCVEGFCPSFVSVVGGRIRKRADQGVDRQRALSDLPSPAFTAYPKHCNILVAGIGGTGVVTIGAILSMAAHVEGRAASVLDITGLAQKGGAVVSHIRLSSDDTSPGAVRIDKQQAHVALLCDAVAALKPDALNTLRPNVTFAIVNSYLAPTPEFTRNPDATINAGSVFDHIQNIAGAPNTRFLDSHDIAQRLFGDSILANMLMLGYAWQQGVIPISLAAIEQAIALNGTAVKMNREAFGMGRALAAKPDMFRPMITNEQTITIHRSESFDALTQRHIESLTRYQDTAYANRYARLIEAVRTAELAAMPHSKSQLAIKAARSLYKLMAYKDEYEIARLFSDGSFRKDLEEEFEGDFTLRFHLAPPILARRHPETGIPIKMTFGPRTEKMFKLLAKGKVLRGTWFDPFGHTQERRAERQLLAQYIRCLKTVSARLTPENHATAVAMAELPMQVRGFGHIKKAAMDQYREKMAPLMETFLQQNVGAEMPYLRLNTRSS